jgi:hypothetical protein
MLLDTTTKCAETARREESSKEDAADEFLYCSIRKKK